MLAKAKMATTGRQVRCKRTGNTIITLRSCNVMPQEESKATSLKLKNRYGAIKRI